MNKYPIEMQDEEKACGAYCILMILKYFGYKEEVKYIKRKARLNQNGISLKGMIECLKTYQIESKAYEATLDHIKDEVTLPCILFMVYENIGHYVVLYEIKDDEYILGDPARGLISIYREEMDDHYALRMLSIIHVGRVPTLTYKPYYRFLLDTMKSYKKHVISLIIKGFWISVLGYGSSYFFQIIIDYIQIDTKFFYIIVICLIYSFIEIIKTSLERIKTTQVIRLKKAIDEDYVFISSMNMLILPYHFFYQDKGYIQSELLSLFDLSDMNIECFERLFLDGLSFIVFLIGMMLINFYMSIVVVVMLIIIGILSYVRLKSLQEIYKNYLESQFIYQHHLLELIENQLMIRNFSLLQRQRERSYDIYLQTALYKEKQGLFLNKLHSLIQYIIYIFYAGVLMLGFYFFQQKDLSLGQLLMFYMLVSFCVQPVLNMVSLLSQYKQMVWIYEKYKVFEREKEEVKDDFISPIKSITLDNVSYAYGYQLPLFEHVDLSIDKHIMISGETGCGKSTLLRLLMGYDMNYSGDIYFNNQELRTIDLSSLYKHIGYMSQSPTFLHMTLFDNLLCQDMVRIKKYLKAFNQSELEDMFHVVLSEDGSPLSLGQRQIIGLIRLLCQDFDVYILDEALSHLDEKLANKVFKYLMKNDENKIYIMVNHQTKLVNKDIEYVIMEKGRIRNKG